MTSVPTVGRAVVEPGRVRRLTDREGQKPQQIVRRGSASSVQTRSLYRYLRWRNAHARHPDVLAAQRKERARIRSEKGIRWCGRPFVIAA